MATINLGSIKFRWQGAYNGATAYVVDDVVSYNGSSYVCILASTGNLPTDGTYWNIMSQKGTDGTDITSIVGLAQGDLLYYDGSNWVRLGAGTAGQLLQSGGTGANVSWTDAPAGITQADQWRLSTDFVGPNVDITSGWERNDSTFSYIGNGITESSGIFSFPSTGIYWVHFSANINISGSSSQYAGVETYLTTNNSTYIAIADCYASYFTPGAHSSVVVNNIIDVTDISTHKVKFKSTGSQGGTPVFLSNTNKNITQATFIRLGDT